MRESGMLRVCFYLGVLSFSACGAFGQDARLNEIQVVHSHNSYRLAPEPSLLEFIKSPLVLGQVQQAAGGLAANFPESLEHSQPRLLEQLSLYGVRAFELDVFYDPSGGLYANQALPKLVTGNGESGELELEMPGWKVLHVPDLDFNTTCFSFKSCLTEIKHWSEQNPTHIPLFVYIEPKAIAPEAVLGSVTVGFLNALLDSPGQPQDLTTSLPVDSIALEALEQEILDVFDMSNLIVPDDLKIRSLTLGESLSQGDGWPALANLRGRVLLTLSPPFFDDLIGLHPNLRGALMFPTALEDGIDGNHTVFVEVGTTDNALKSPRISWDRQVDQLAARVRNVVSQGYIVRAFVDGATLEAREGYTYRRDQVMAAGAHLLSTDFPGGKTPELFESTYSVGFADNAVVVCNPVTAAQTCTDIDFIAKLPAEEELPNRMGNEEDSSGTKERPPEGSSQLRDGETLSTVFWTLYCLFELFLSVFIL